MTNHRSIMAAPIDSASGDENEGADFVFARPLRPGAYWVRVDGQSGPAVDIDDDIVRDASPVHSRHPAWPHDIKTMADSVGRVEWFLYPEQYLTEAQFSAAATDVVVAVTRARGRD